MTRATLSQATETNIWQRRTLFFGIAYSLVQLAVLAYFATMVFPKLGPPDTAFVQRAAAYKEFGEVIRLGNYLITLPALLFLVFVSGLFGNMRNAESSASPFPTLVLASGTAMAMLWPISAVINDIAIDAAQSGGDAATVAAFDAVGPYMLALSSLPRALFIGGIAMTLSQGKVTLRWVGWTGLVLAVVSLLGSATMAFGGLFPLLALGTLLFEIWIIALCIALLRQQNK